jgi:hypothetical protein
MPQDLVNDQMGRLALFSLIGVALWTTGLLIDQLVMLTMPSVYRYTGWKPHALEVLGIIVSGLMYVYVRYARHTPKTKTNVSLAYLILNAAAIAALVRGVAAAHADRDIRVSWVAILVLVFSMVAPASPARCSPPCCGIAGSSAYGLRICAPCLCRRHLTFIIFWPNYVAAALSTVPSRFLRAWGTN